MKNNRKIEVGQMREFRGCSLYRYIILRIEGDVVKILPLWKDEDTTSWWDIEDLQNDIVVM